MIPYAIAKHEKSCEIASPIIFQVTNIFTLFHKLFWLAADIIFEGNQPYGDDELVTADINIYHQTLVAMCHHDCLITCFDTVMRS